MMRLLTLLALLLFSASASTHEVRPAYLEVRQDAPNHFVVIWKQPVMGEMAIRLIPHLSSGWLETPPASELITPAFLIRTWQIRSPASNPLPGSTIHIEGLERTITDALVSVRLADGRSFETILTPDRTSVELTFQHTRSLAVRAYFQLGVAHILTGVDHLMFVLGLLLLVGIRWRLVKAITAFTVAHSITLAASAVGIVHVQPAVIEALVALSIVFVASELVNQRPGRSSLAARYPWLIAFIFGLLHGFAFAGALAEVGLPQDAIPLSLLLFNLGVEVGQLLFVGAAVAAILALRQVWPRLPGGWSRLVRRIPPYAIGSFAAFWFLERTAAVFV
jgi:hydrogenase/urease accessory protein HupE